MKRDVFLLSSLAAAGCAGSTLSSIHSLSKARINGSDVECAPGRDCGPTPPPSGSITKVSTTTYGTGTATANQSTNISHYGLNSGSSTLYTGTIATTTPQSTGLNSQFNATFAGQSSVSGAVYFPGSISVTSPTAIPTSNSEVTVYTDPNGQGATCSFSTSRGTISLSLYPYGTSGNQLQFVISGPAGSTTTIITLPQALSVNSIPNGMQVASLSDFEIAQVRCCQCISMLGWGLAGVAAIFFALSGLGLIVEVGTLGAAAGVFGGSVGAGGFIVETIGKFAHCA